MGNLRITLLGTPTVTHDGAKVSGFVSSKAQALLFYLALSKRQHTRPYLASLFWGEIPESDARASLRVALYNLRQLIPDYLVISRETVAFNTQAPHWIDVVVLRDRECEIKALLPIDEPVCDLLALYRGEFLEGFSVRDAPEFDAWAALERERLRDTVTYMLHDFAARAAKRGDHKHAITYAKRLLELDPYFEEGHRLLMQSHMSCGQRNAAIAQYELCRKVLAEELGIEPSSETIALAQRLRTTEYARNKRLQRVMPLVGRANEYAWLVQQWKLVQRGAAKFVLIEGEAGIGKTRLLEELISHCASQGAASLWGRCHAFGDELPYQPLVAAIRPALRAALPSAQHLPLVWRAELARLFPEFLEENPGLASPLPSNDVTARQRLFEAVARLLLALNLQATEYVSQRSASLVIALDDIHDVDQATLDLLHFLLYRLSNSTIWFVSACRNQEINVHYSLQKLRYTLSRDNRIALLQLGALDIASAEQLALQMLSAANSDTALVPYVTRLAEANPFFMEQIVYDLAKSGTYPEAVEHQTTLIPDAMRDLMLAQLKKLSVGARQLVLHAAPLGRTIKLTQLDIHGLNGSNITQSLAECLQSGILKAQPDETYVFRYQAMQYIAENNAIF